MERSGDTKEFVEHTEKKYGQVQEQLKEKSVEYKERVDVHRRYNSFVVGNSAIIHFRIKSYAKGAYRELNVKKIKLCSIKRKFDNNAYEVELPTNFDILSIFNVIDLYEYREGDIVTKEYEAIEEGCVKANWHEQLPRTKKEV